MAAPIAHTASVGSGYTLEVGRQQPPCPGGFAWSADVTTPAGGGFRHLGPAPLNLPLPDAGDYGVALTITFDRPTGCAQAASTTDLDGTIFRDLAGPVDTCNITITAS